MKKIDKYFSKFAEAEVEQLKDFPEHINYQYSLVVPLYHESLSFYQSFTENDFINQSILLILVINQPSTCDDLQQQDLWNQILSHSHPVWQHKQLYLADILNSNSSVLLIDRFSQGLSIPKNQGVGLARKIGSDIACWLIHKGQVKSPFVGSTDGDAQLPCNYFSVLPSSTSIALVIFNFSHQLEQSDETSTILQATKLYEQSLRYYVAGLTWAGSEYNYFTIGSTLAFNFRHYCQARGFPRKSAAEDFYLINKLAKLGEVLQRQNIIVKIKARLSDRVPFGTGPAVKKILKLLNFKEYSSYHPDVFYQLRLTLKALSELWHHRHQSTEYFSTLPLQSFQALDNIDFFIFTSKLTQQNIKQNQFNTQVLHWFDSFKTLKFIHYLKNHYYPNIGLIKALEICPFKKDI